MAMSDMAGREPSTAHGAASEAQRREGLRYEEDLRRIVERASREITDGRFETDPSAFRRSVTAARKSDA